MLKDALLIIAILFAFFLGYIAVCGVDRFFGNSGKWIKMQFMKNKASFISKTHPVKKEKTPNSEQIDSFFRTNIGESRHFSVINMENRADL